MFLLRKSNAAFCVEVNGVVVGLAALLLAGGTVETGIAYTAEA